MVEIFQMPIIVNGWYKCEFDLKLSTDGAVSNANIQLYANLTKRKCANSKSTGFCDSKKIELLQQQQRETKRIAHRFGAVVDFVKYKKKQFHCGHLFSRSAFRHLNRFRRKIVSCCWFLFLFKFHFHLIMATKQAVRNAITLVGSATIISEYLSMYRLQLLSMLFSHYTF